MAKSSGGGFTRYYVEYDHAYGKSKGYVVAMSAALVRSGVKHITPSAKNIKIRVAK